jgi:hypothetical protein
MNKPERLPQGGNMDGKKEKSALEVMMESQARRDAMTPEERAKKQAPSET